MAFLLVSTPLFRFPEGGVVKYILFHSKKSIFQKKNNNIYNLKKNLKTKKILVILLVQVVLNNATQETDNPDLRDRAYVYWRLLSTDPEAAKDVVLAEKPVISDDSNQLDPSLLDELLGNISTLSSVYHKPPEVFVSRTKVVPLRDEEELEIESGPEESSGPAPPAMGELRKNQPGVCVCCFCEGMKEG